MSNEKRYATKEEYKYEKAKTKNMTTTSLKSILAVPILLVLFLLIPSTLALGITPAKTTISSETTSSYSGTIWVINNDHQEFTAGVSAGGELGQYVSVSPSELRFRDDVEALPIEYTITLPAKVRPGESTAEIVVAQTLDETSPAVISSIIVLKHKIIVLGPYPDKYLTAKLNFHESGQNIRLVSEVENLGKLDLQAVQTKFYLNDKQQKEQVLETETTPLKRQENKLLETNLDRQVLERGEFEVRAITTYDDQKVEVIKRLLVGRPEVEITYFDKYFRAHEVNSYALELLNKWNQEVDNVYVDIEVRKDEQKIDEFRTKSIAIPAEMAKRINDYFDARDKNSGKYAFDLIVHFLNVYTMDTKRFHGELLSAEEMAGLDDLPRENAVESKPEAISGAATADSSLPSRTYLWWIVGGVGGMTILLLLTLGGLWLYRRHEAWEENEISEMSGRGDKGGMSGMSDKGEIRYGDETTPSSEQLNQAGKELEQSRPASTQYGKGTQNRDW